MRARLLLSRSCTASKQVRFRLLGASKNKPCMGWHSFSTERHSIEPLSQRTEDLLRYLTKDDIDHNTKKPITLIHFDDAMNEWAEKCTPDAARRAEQLLVALEKNFDRVVNDPDYSTALIPNSISYNHVLRAFAQSDGGTKSAIKCDNILDRMLSRFTDENGVRDDIIETKSPSVTTHTFNTCMHSWSKSKDPNAGINAERIFRKMERWNYDVEKNSESRSHFNDAQPNTRSLAIVIDSWANSNHEEAYDRILAIFYHAVDKLSENKGEYNESGPSSYQVPVIPLNTVVFNSVLNGLANSTRGVEAGTKASEIISIMEDLNANGILQKYINREEVEEEMSQTKPNTTTWSLLVKCWANAVVATDPDGGEYAASEAEAILNKMEERYEMKPNAITYNDCLKAWARCSSESGATRALSILERMQQLFEASADISFKPNIIHYNTCLSAFSRLKSKSSVNQAKDLFAKMQRNRVLDTASYNIMMKVHSTNYPSIAHTQLELLYNEMKSIGISPDVVTFNTMLDSFGKSAQEDAYRKVTKLLNQMINLSKQDPNFTPTTESFTVALNTIAQSRVDEKVEPGRKVFHELLSMHEARNDDKMKPDVRTFAAFISVCANQGGDIERRRFALKLALATYEQLCKQTSYGVPNSFIYGALFKGCGRLTSDPKEKLRLMEHLFNKCIEDGQLSRVTFQKFLKGAPHSLKEKLLGGLPNKQLPFEWYRNVKTHERP